MLNWIFNRELNYYDYLKSPRWQRKRRQRLKHDKYRCRTCWSTKRLEVHHCTYDRLGREKLDDLITLCRDCHQAVSDSIKRRK